MTYKGRSQNGSHNRMHVYRERLQVYQFKAKAEEWAVTVTVRLVQEVRDMQVQAALQFRDLHDNKRYVAILNITTSPCIYWWNWDQLQEWQILESPPVGPTTSMTVVPLGNLEHILCLSHQNFLCFYADDLTGHYVLNFVARTSCRSVSSLQAVRLGQDYLQHGDTLPGLTEMQRTFIYVYCKHVLSALADRLLYTDVAEPQTISGQLTLTSLHVAGIVDVMSINSVDLNHLDDNTVKTSGNFKLQGPVRYMEDLRVAESLGASLVNGVEWPRLLDRHSPHQQVLSKFTFTSAFVSQAIISDDINGVDLSEDGVLVDTMQTISGRVRFKSTVTVTGPAGVIVDEGVTVNNVDISRLLSDLATIETLVVPDLVTFTEPLTCSGDITAVNINDLSLKHIESRYWRVSVPQLVDVPVSLARAVFMINH